MFLIDLPTSVQVSQKKRFYLNLNTYRNAHHHVLNKAKVLFEGIVKPRLCHLPRMEKVNLTYTFFAGRNGRADTANVCSIVDKFFSDTLVNCGKLEDDNCNVVLSVLYRYGGVDKNDPRVEVTVEPVEEFSETTPQKEADMQITIHEHEIKKAITEYIGAQGLSLDNMDVEVDLRATRGPEGYQAIIEITPKRGGSAARTPAPAAPKPASGGDKPLKIEETVTAAKAKGDADKNAEKSKDAPKAELDPDLDVSIDSSIDVNIDTDTTQLDVAVVDNEPVAETVSETAPAPALTAATETEAPKSIFAAVKKVEEEAPPPPSNGKKLFGDMKHPVNA